jgi:hypothetical protein
VVRVTDGYDDAERVTVRFGDGEIETLAALDNWIDRDDTPHGNRSDAIRDFIADGVTDDGPTTPARDEHVPSDPSLEAVYRAAVAAADQQLLLDTDLLSAVAKTVNNDADVPLSPDTSSIETLLRRLQDRGYAYKHTKGNWNGTNTVSQWRLKPPAAEPDLWTWNVENVRQRREERRQVREDTWTGRVQDDRESKTIDTAAWLADEQEATADGGRE